MELLAAPQVPQALFAHIAAQNQVAHRLQAGFLESPGQAEHLGQRAGVVANAGAAVDAVLLRHVQRLRPRKYGIQMAGDQHSGPVGIRAGNDSVDVARSVRYRLITHLVQAAGKILRALSLVVGGGGNLHNFQLGSLLGPASIFQHCSCLSSPFFK